jgi:hypothetical protein
MMSQTALEGLSYVGIGLMISGAFTLHYGFGIFMLGLVFLVISAIFTPSS